MEKGVLQKTLGSQVQRAWSNFSVPGQNSAVVAALNPYKARRITVLTRDLDTLKMTNRRLKIFFTVNFFYA